MYGKSWIHDRGDPFNPCSKRNCAQIATTWSTKSKQATGLIARSADFYGLDARTSVANILVFEKFAHRATASWLVNDSMPHSYTYTSDAAKSLAILAATQSAWNQTWHVPTASNPPTGKEFVKLVAKEFGVEPKYRILSRPLIKVAGLFDSDIRESYEMLYQSDSAYLFDSTKFSKAFSFEPTSYAEGIRCTALAYKSPMRSR
jgi:nucleoside-diphosphate-sugar epimerase